MADTRAVARQSSDLTARMTVRGQTVVVRIPNISPNGAKILADVPFPARGEIELHLANHIAMAEIRWANGCEAGVMFFSHLPETVIAALMAQRAT